MALKLSDLKKVRADKPPRVLIYGTAGIGKTTLASEFPSPVFLQIEDGTPAGLELNSFGKIDNFNQLMDALRVLYKEPHEFKTVVVDSVSELQRLVFDETCRRGDEKGNAKNNIEDFGYGKGYIYALRIWQEFIEAIHALRNHKSMTVILIAHSVVERFDDPETASYDRYTLDLHGRSVGLIERDMDAIFLLKQPVSIKTEDEGFNRQRARADGAGVVLIYTSGRPAFIAKNRYNMPPTIRFDRGKGFAALSGYFPKDFQHDVGHKTQEKREIETQEKREIETQEKREIV